MRKVKRIKDQKNPFEKFAKELGCPDPFSANYGSGAQRWTWFTFHSCANLQSILIDKKYDSIEHYTFSPCSRVYKEGADVLCIKKTRSGKSLIAHIHKIGECPYCEYRE